ncbi:MAG TPA: DUF4038 domain-containing protein [Vicinamibacterales bacterium]
MRCVLASFVLLAGFAISQEAGSTNFPLTVSADARYLQESDGTPFPILGRSYWGIIGLSPANYQAAINDAVAKGFNAIEFRAPNGSWQDNFVPFNGAGQLPFTTKLGGGAYTGSGSPSETPDFTTPNEPYWQFLDTFIAYCASKGIAVLWFPAYVGYGSDGDGWMLAMVNNGASRMRTYGAYVANRYKNYGNIIWMVGGDKGAQNNPFVGSEITVERALIDGLKSVAGQSTQFAAEWDSDTTGSSEPNFGGDLTLNSSYSWEGETATWCRAGYTSSPVKPTFLIEEPYDEEGSDGTQRNSSATQPVRRFIWWGLLNGIGGYMAGNGYLIHFLNGYASHFDSPGQIDLAHLNTLYKSISWYQLVPSGLAGMKTLITAGSGGIGSNTYVASAAAPNGTLLLAYASPNGTASRSFTVDMTAMHAASRARWFNPTSGSYSDIASSLPNTGTRAFTTPGNNGRNDNDWVLVLDTGDVKTPNPPTNLTVE